MFFGFERLMQAFGITPARHHAARELIDDHDFVVADNIVLVALKQFVRAQRLIDVMDDRHIARVVERRILVDQAGVVRSSSICSLPSSVRLTVRCFSSTSQSSARRCGTSLSIVL